MEDGDKMLIYNDYKASADKRIEEVYGVFIPEDNFWCRLKRIVDFDAVYALLKDTCPFIKYKNVLEIVRLFKVLLLKTYYELDEASVIERLNTDLEFRCFLEYDPIESCNILKEDLIEFENVKIDTVTFLNHVLLCDTKNFKKGELESGSLSELAKVFIERAKYIVKKK